MFKKKTLVLTALVAVLIFSACTSSSINSNNNYFYNGINFGADRDASFKKGVKDACNTANGNYTKNHYMFNNNKSYKDGWEDGRLQCKGN